MDISEVGIAFIKEWEGFEPQVYDDVAGYGTIGYGHKLRAGERFGALTEAQADTLLRSDLARFVRAVNNSVPGSLTQNQFDALVSFTYNVGEGALLTSTLIRRMREGDIAGAADEFKRWTYAGGKPVAGLAKRRLAERALFLGEISTS